MIRARDSTRILRELRQVQKENKDELFMAAKDDNIRSWIAVIKAPDGTPFEGHYYEVALTLPEGYPIDPPKARFLTPIFHPNIHFKKGKVCLDILKAKWTPAWGIQAVCNAISALLNSPEPDSPLNTLAANLLRFGDEVGYWSMASMYAKRFAATSNALFAKALLAKAQQ
jgi:peroxin-4